MRVSVEISIWISRFFFFVDSVGWSWWTRWTWPWCTRWSWTWQGRSKGMGTSNKIGPFGSWRKDPFIGRDLLVLIAHQGVRNHRHFLGTTIERRSIEDYARAETNSCRSTYSFQGIRCHRWQQRSHRSRCQVQQRSCNCHPWCHHLGQIVRCPRSSWLLGQQNR